MAHKFTVTFDATDASHLARFWQIVLGYVEEPPPPGFASWEAFAAANDIPAEKTNDYGSAIDPDGVGPRLLFLRVPETKVAKNRMHLDIAVSGGRSVDIDERVARLEAAAQRIVAAGATELARHNELGTVWRVMADPEGNEFCIH
jgi:Glyoxalase-like domain